MAKFEEAYFKLGNEDLSIENYVNNIHYGKIYCPECHKAPLHIVQKQNIAPYYASNSQQEHIEDCQHHQEFISSRGIKGLLSSESIEDKNRLKFLINSNLLGAINLLLKNNSHQSNQTTSISSKGFKSSLSVIKEAYKIESIPRMNIKNLFKKKDIYLDNYLVIWGGAEIESRMNEFENSKTKEKFSVKKLIFRVQGKFRFSVSLSENQLKYYKELSAKKSKVGFAIFGFLTENNGYFEVKVLTTNHIQYT